jgi:hypothetical protein
MKTAMKRVLSTLATLGILLSGQAAIAIPPKPQITGTQKLQPPNQMIEMLSAWGFIPTACQGNVVEIRNSITRETACVQPNGEIGVGKFVYDAMNNQIRPDVAIQENQQVILQENQSNFGHVNPVPQTEDPRIAEMVFTFDNLYDYGTCLDGILIAYEGRDIERQKMNKNECANNVINLFGTRLSKDITLQLIDLANFRATKLLQNELYPSFGLRRRIAMNLGYIYEIDKNNTEILEYAASAN